MRSFLGVPITGPGGRVIGAFYLTEKADAEVFDAEDQALIELLAAHASIAITNARLYEQSRELSILSERNRLALELHDVVSQKLFSVMLTAEAAATQLDRELGGSAAPDGGALAAARAQLERLRELAGEALEELRSLIFELRPPELERDGLLGTLRKEVEVVARTHGTHIELSVEPGFTSDGGDSDRELTLLRIAHEALHNAVRHAKADHVTVRLAGEPDKLVIEVSDDGVGFDPHAPDVRSRHLGLTSMEERARESHGRLQIRSAPGQGTTVRVELGSDVP
jgi:signal transduction histidine kinase